MARAGGGWIPDGRAKAIRADCEASLEALDGLPIDLYLIHAPDPRTPWRTSVRALARLVDDGLVRRVGVANVNRRQLDEALELRADRGGAGRAHPSSTTARYAEASSSAASSAGSRVIAHSPLGGPRRAGSLARQQALADVAECARRDAGRGRARLAARALARRRRDPGRPSPGDGALRAPAAAAARARRRRPRRRSPRAFGGARASSREPADAQRARARCVARDGHPGSRQEPHRRGVRRARLRPPQPRRARRLAPRARGGARRGARVGHPAGRPRQHVPHARSRGATWSRRPRGTGSRRAASGSTRRSRRRRSTSCERLLERFGSLPTPEEVREAAKREPGIHAPTTQMRAFRELEPPADDEGFASVERIAFERTSAGGSAGAASSSPRRR